jgi:murein DD-endopeptidase
MGTTNELSNIAIDGNTVRFEVKRVSGRFEGVLDPDRKKLSGVWTQAGFREPLVLARPDQPAVMDPALEGIDARVPYPPAAVRAGGREWLFYEVHITNWSTEEMTLLRLDLLIGEDQATIESDLLKKLAVAGGVKLRPGVRSVLMIPASGDHFPDSIHHRVTFQLAGESQPRSTECAPAAVRRSPVRIGPPVGAGSWQMAAGPDGDMHHRGAIIAYQGRATISQRFAFDLFVETSEEPDHTANESYPTYGAPLLAVADGTVASVVDGLPDNPPGALLAAVPLTPGRMFGNRVTMDIGGGRFVTYAHMRAGLGVKTGEKVLRGQVLGAIGSSGRSGAPHLHFQVTDGPDPIASEGVPFVFESFTHEGAKYTGEMPFNRWVVSFPK